MRKNSMGELFVAMLAFVGFVVCSGLLCGAFESKPKCMKAGCENEQASGSSYCYLHKPYGSHYSTNGSTSSYNSNSTTGSTSDSSATRSSVSHEDSSKSQTTTSRPGSTTSSYKSSSYDSYDKGHDDIYMDGDYDWDRYNSDPDYADGVDDAMDEYGEDW